MDHLFFRILPLIYAALALDPLCVPPYGPQACLHVCNDVAVVKNPIHPKRYGCCDQAGDCYCCTHFGICGNVHSKYHCSSCERIRIETTCSTCSGPSTSANIYHPASQHHQQTPQNQIPFPQLIPGNTPQYNQQGPVHHQPNQLPMQPARHHSDNSQSFGIHNSNPQHQRHSGPMHNPDGFGGQGQQGGFPSNFNVGQQTLPGPNLQGNRHGMIGQGLQPPGMLQTGPRRHNFGFSQSPIIDFGLLPMDERKHKHKKLPYRSHHRIDRHGGQNAAQKSVKATNTEPLPVAGSGGNAPASQQPTQQAGLQQGLPSTQAALQHDQSQIQQTGSQQGQQQPQQSVSQQGLQRQQQSSLNQGSAQPQQPPLQQGQQQSNFQQRPQQVQQSPQQPNFQQAQQGQYQSNSQQGPQQAQYLQQGAQQSNVQQGQQSPQPSHLQQGQQGPQQSYFQPGSQQAHHLQQNSQQSNLQQSPQQSQQVQQTSQSSPQPVLSQGPQPVNQVTSQASQNTASFYTKQSQQTIQQPTQNTPQQITQTGSQKSFSPGASNSSPQTPQRSNPSQATASSAPTQFSKSGPQQSVPAQTASPSQSQVSPQSGAQTLQDSQPSQQLTSSPYTSYQQPQQYGQTGAQAGPQPSYQKSPQSGPQSPQQGHQVLGPQASPGANHPNQRAMPPLSQQAAPQSSGLGPQQSPQLGQKDLNQQQSSIGSQTPYGYQKDDSQPSRLGSQSLGQDEAQPQDGMVNPVTPTNQLVSHDKSSQRLQQMNDGQTTGQLRNDAIPTHKQIPTAQYHSLPSDQIPPGSAAIGASDGTGNSYEQPPHHPGSSAAQDTHIEPQSEHLDDSEQSGHPHDFLEAKQNQQTDEILHGYDLGGSGRASPESQHVIDPAGSSNQHNVPASYH